MEIQPDLVDIMNDDAEANFQLLQSLAEQVEQQEGRGEPKVVRFLYNDVTVRLKDTLEMNKYWIFTKDFITI